MPYKFYHGKTGRIFNVTKRAVGVLVNKQIRYVMHEEELSTICYAFHCNILGIELSRNVSIFALSMSSIPVAVMIFCGG